MIAVLRFRLSNCKTPVKNHRKIMETRLTLILLYYLVITKTLFQTVSVLSAVVIPVFTGGTCQLNMQPLNCDSLYIWIDRYPSINI